MVVVYRVYFGHMDPTWMEGGHGEQSGLTHTLFVRLPAVPRVDNAETAAGTAPN